MTTILNKTKNTFILFVLVLCTVVSLACPSTVEAKKSKVKIIRKTVTITFTDKDADGKKIDLRKALGKFKDYVTTDAEYVKLTQNAYGQELYFQKPGVYWTQIIEDDTLRKSFKLTAKRGNQKLILTVKMKDKRESDGFMYADNFGLGIVSVGKPITDKQIVDAMKKKDEWYVKCIDELNAIIADEDSMADFFKTKAKREFKDNVPFKTKQLCCAEYWLATRMHYDHTLYDGKKITNDYSNNHITFKDLYEGNFYGICGQGAKAECLICKGVGIDAKMVSSNDLDHAWCIVKAEDCGGNWWAQGINTPSSFALTFPWSQYEYLVKHYEDVNDNSLFHWGTVIDMYSYYGENGEIRKFRLDSAYSIFTQKIKKKIATLKALRKQGFCDIIPRIA